MTKICIGEKEKWTNKGNDQHEGADSLLHNTNFTGAEKCVKKTFIGEKEKWVNKCNDKHEDADSLLHTTKSHAQCFYQISMS